MDYLFEDSKQTFDEELSYIFDENVEDISSKMCEEFDKMGFIFEEEDIEDVLRNNQDKIKHRLKKKLENKEHEDLKKYKKDLKKKGYSKKKMKMLIKKWKKNYKNE